MLIIAARGRAYEGKCHEICEEKFPLVYTDLGTDEPRKALWRAKVKCYGECIDKKDFSITVWDLFQYWRR